jgi:hypothetical protein
MEKVCGQPVTDRVTTNELSDWVDTFVPAAHEHLWYSSSSSRREHWFGSRVIGCGPGMSAIPTIYRQRAELGEAEARRLAEQFHDLATTPGVEDRFAQLRAFEKAVRD